MIAHYYFRVLTFRLLICMIELVPDLFFFLSIIFVQIRNEKARRYLSCMRKKKPIPLTHKFPNADPLALRLLERMLAFEPKDRPTAEEVGCTLYFV